MWDKNYKRLKRFFRKTRDCQSIAGFLFEKTPGPMPGKKRKVKMNTNYKRVPARFDPETRFEVKPARPTAGRAAQDIELERLKNRLLAQTLNELAVPEAGGFVRRAAIEAAALAWETRFPLLVFPGLFEEKTQTALLQTERQASVRRRSLDLFAV
jgi:hypothetical protein